MISEPVAAPSDATYIAGFQPGFLGRIAQMHGEYYSRVWGSGVAFEEQMARELCDFYDTYDPNRDLLLTAHVDGELIGSIAVNGAQTERPGAQLRWYLMAEECQGRGIGRVLLERALAFCREKGFDSVFLWTVAGLPQSLHLYEKAGFRIAESFPSHRYTVQHTLLRLEMALL